MRKKPFHKLSLPGFRADLYLGIFDQLKFRVDKFSRLALMLGNFSNLTPLLENIAINWIWCGLIFAPQ